MERVFVSGMAYGKGQSGTSVYINSVVAELCKNYQVDLLLLTDDEFPIKSENLRVIRVSQKLAHPVTNMLWHLFVLPFSFNYKKYSLVFLPAANRRLFCRNLDNLVVTFHDLSQFHIPNKYDAFRVFYIKKVIPFFLKNTKKIIAISQATKNDLIKFYGLDKNNIQVNYNGFTQAKVDSMPNRSHIRALLLNVIFYMLLELNIQGKII